MKSSFASGSLLSVESEIPSPPPSAPPAHALSLSLSNKYINLKKKKHSMGWGQLLN